MSNGADGLISRIYRRLFASTTAANPAKWFIDWINGGEETLSGVTVNQESALKASAVWACVKVRAEALSSLPLILYEDLGGGRKDRARKEPLYSLFSSEPNDEQDILQFLEFGQASIDLWGNFFAFNVTDGRGQTIRLEQIHPSCARGRRLESGRVAFDVFSGYQWKSYRPDQILHVPSLAISADRINGLSNIAYHKNAIGLTLAAEEYGASFFGNSAMPSGVIESKKEMTPEQKKQTLLSWNDRHGGSKRAGRVGVLDQERTFKAIGVPNEDSQWLETRDFQIEDIARIFNVPNPLINHHKHSTFSNVEQLSLNFRIYGMRPMGRRWEYAINRQCLTTEQKQRLFVEFLVEELLSADLAAKANFITQMCGWGIMTPNEGRAKLNMNPLPGLDRPMLPLNYVPADRIDEAFDAKKQGGGQPNPSKMAMRMALDGMVRDRLTRLVRIEVEQLCAASKREGNFIGWMDRFYEQHVAKLHECVRSVLPVVNAHQGRETGANEAEAVAKEYAEASRKYVLAVCDVSTRENLPDNIATAVANWDQSRVDALAGRLFREDRDRGAA